ncbi:hypothetical protein AALA00_04340 [Lachnospiraceae bacterium 46-15]
MKRKVYAVLMAVCLVLGILPVQVFAETEKEEVKVTVTGETVVGEKLKANLSELKDVSEAVIQWQKKGSGEEDSKAIDTGDGEKSLTLKAKDAGKVFRIIVKEDKDSKTSYTSKWTKEVRKEAESETEKTETKETKDSKIEASGLEEKQTEKKDGTEAVKTPEAKETEKEKAPETKGTEVIKAPETKDAESAKEPETKGTEVKSPEMKDVEAVKAPETKDTKAEALPKNTENNIPREGETESEAPAPALSIDKAAVDFGSAEEGYIAAPGAQTITITNGGAAAIKLTQPQANDFVVGSLSKTDLEAGGTAAFTIQPKTGLKQKAYEETLEIAGDNGEKLEIKAKFQVSAPKPAPVYMIKANTAELNFTSQALGYKAPDAQTVEITNTGTGAVKLVQPSAAAFDIGALSTTELAVGAKASFTVRPKAGLDSGTYEETITVKTEQGSGAAVKAVFKVTGSKILSIVNPSAVTKKNGQDKKASALGLPEKVKIKTSDGTKKANVTWNVKDANYSKYKVKTQKFKVTGKVKLPDGVYNPDKISLNTSISVTVKAYVPKVADSSSNKILNLEAGKTYRTNTDIVFQAVGGGMDNKEPKEGDVRYRPVSWAVSTVNSFTTDEFKGTFKFSNAGDYTLKVTYNRQKYDGDKWVDDGTVDTKSVSFKLASSTVTPGTVRSGTGSTSTNYTSTVNTGKAAAKTGDDSPIVPLVIVCLVCLLCIGGVVYSKKRRDKDN